MFFLFYINQAFLYVLLGIVLFLFKLRGLEYPVKKYKGKPEAESYECGFSSLTKIYKNYSLQFFLVALSFMLFDLEIGLFLPVVGRMFLSSFSFYVRGVFLLIITFIYLYEVKLGILKV